MLRLLGPERIGAAWAAACDRFRGAYGDPPDAIFDSEEDRAAFLALLDAELAERVERDFTAAIRLARERLRAVAGA